VISSLGALAPGPGAHYLAGTANDAAGHSALAVARFIPNGALDDTFQWRRSARVQTGIRRPATPASFREAPQGDGSILLVGSS
jgi:hypothetical protein